MERVGRKDDENLYQPKIHARWIRALYRMSRITRPPMTVLVNQALKEFCTDRAAGATPLSAGEAAGAPEP